MPWIRRLVREGRDDPLVKRRAQLLAASRPGVAPVVAVFEWVRSLPYRTDQSIARRHRLGVDRPDAVQEVLQGAGTQLRRGDAQGLGAMEGDCDCRCVLFQALAESLGYPTRICLMRGPGREDFSHVYPEVRVNGRWITADTIMDGRQGRPFFRLGDQLPSGEARDVTSFPVG